MKLFKMLGAATVVAALMMFGVGPASATVLTSPAATQYNGTMKFELEQGTVATFKNSFFSEIACSQSTIEAKVEGQGSSVTATGSLSTVDFSECNGPFTALKTGSFEIHTDSASADGNGIVTSSGAEITFELAGPHCILSTSNTTLGTVTGGTPARFATNSAAIPRTGGRSGAFCGSSMSFAATYKVGTPETLLVD